jgi:predicted membrane protein
MNAASEKVMLVAKIFGQVLFIFGMLAWLDGVVIQFTNPMWLAMPVSHLFLWLRTDTFTILSFIASAIGFFIWRLAAELIKLDQNKSTRNT